MMKYIRLIDDEIYIFPSITAHSEVAAGQQVASAGFVAFHLTGVSATGKSQTLGLPARPDIDDYILQKILFEIEAYLIYSDRAETFVICTKAGLNHVYRFLDEDDSVVYPIQDWIEKEGAWGSTQYVPVLQGQPSDDHQLRINIKANL